MDKTTTQKEHTELLEKRISMLWRLFEEEVRESRRLHVECQKLLKANRRSREQALRERKARIELLRQHFATDNRGAQMQLAHNNAMADFRRLMRMYEQACRDNEKELSNHYWTCARQAKRKADLALSE